MIRGRVWKYGNDVNTDVIYPGKYVYTISDATEMAKHALETVQKRFNLETMVDGMEEAIRYCVAKKAR